MVSVNEGLSTDAVIAAADTNQIRELFWVALGIDVDSDTATTSLKNKNPELKKWVGSRNWEILPPSSSTHSSSDDILDVVALPSGAIDGGPTLDGLQTGEKVIVTSSKLLSRSGREDIKFRVVGDRSFGWGEAAVAWGDRKSVV